MPNPESSSERMRIGANMHDIGEFLIWLSLWAILGFLGSLAIAGPWLFLAWLVFTS